MTPLEAKVRAAIRAKAARVTPEAVPPLRLTVRRRSYPPAYRGGGRIGARQLRWLTPAAAAVAVAAVVTLAVGVPRAVLGPAAMSAAERAAQENAAQWVAAQVSRSVVVSCDPAMCQALRAHGLPAGGLLELRSAAVSPLRSAVIVATPAVRREFGHRLGSVYAPAVLASFGSGTERVEVRVIVPDGAAAYRSASWMDLGLRKQTGAQLLSNSRLAFTATAMRQMAAGRADSRLMFSIIDMAMVRPISVVALADSGPGASEGIPLRSLTVTVQGSSPDDGSVFLQAVLSRLKTQPSPWYPSRIEIVRLPRGQTGLRIEFTAPSPLGLLGTAPPVRSRPRT
jgi:hypothetical protein